MVESILQSTSLLLLSIAMLGLAYFAWGISRKIFYNPVVVDLIFFFVFIKISLVYFMPTVFRIFSNYQFEVADNVAIFDLILVYFIELISWSVWTAFLLGVFRMVSVDKKKLEISNFINLRFSESKIILIVLVVGFVTTRIATLLKFEYFPLLDMFNSLFYFAGLASGPLLMVLSLRYFGKSFFFLGAISSLLSLLSITTRAAIIYSFLFIFFLVWFVLKDRRFAIITLGVLCAFTIVYFTFGGLFTGALAIDETGAVSIDSGVNIDKKADRSALQEIEWRFGAPTRMGTAFINLYNRGEGAGFNPIKHSLMGLLPRSLNPDKPHPSTLDGDDIYSQGMYIIYREINGYNTASMVDFPTGGHFYWEFGIMGVLTLSAISGLYVALCAHFFSKLGLVALPFMVTIFKPWGYVDPKIWVSDIVLQLYQIILPLILLIFIVRFVFHRSRILNESMLFMKNVA